MLPAHTYPVFFSQPFIRRCRRTRWTFIRIIEIDMSERHVSFVRIRNKSLLFMKLMTNEHIYSLFYATPRNFLVSIY